MKKVFVVLCIALGLISCGNNVDLAIDNPTSEAVFVKVDSLEVEVPAEQVVWVEMGKGDHSITLANDSIVNFNFTESIYMINPTLSEYLMYGEYYGSQSWHSIYEKMSPKNKVQFLGFEFEGDYAVVKDVINPIIWDYGPREELPEMVEMEEGDNYEILQKLYSANEFIELMQRESQAK